MFAMIGLFCKRALQKRLYSCQRAYNIKTCMYVYSELFNDRSLLQKCPTKAFAKEPNKKDSIFAKEPTI